MKGALIASSLALALVSGPALAADMGMPVKAPAPPPPAYSWSGCYVNAGVGYDFWNNDFNYTTSFGGVPNGATIESTSGGRGWLGRFGGGCDIQLGSIGLSNWVIGVLGDYDAMNAPGSLGTLLVTGGGSPIVATENENSAWYVGGRLGYLVTPGLLAYTEGGWTQTRFNTVNYTTNLGVPLGTGFPAQTYNGWFIGGGTEYALNFSWLPIHGLFWRSEYRYGDYGPANLTEINFTTGLPSGNAGLGNIEHTQRYTQTITSSLVWRFNWFGQ
jgi:outer membrane immunogenic protein